MFNILSIISPFPDSSEGEANIWSITVANISKPERICWTLKRRKNKKRSRKEREERNQRKKGNDLIRGRRTERIELYLTPVTDSNVILILSINCEITPAESISVFYQLRNVDGVLLWYNRIQIIGKGYTWDVWWRCGSFSTYGRFLSRLHREQLVISSWQMLDHLP